MSVEQTDFFIHDNHMGTVTQMNHILEFQYMEKANHQVRIRKIDKNRYVLLATGEIKEFEKHSKTRVENENSLRQTFKKLGYRINANFTGTKNELFLTMTFKERVTDVKEASKEYFNFLRRFERAYAHLGTIRMLSVKEPQADGTWHFHTLVKFLDQKKVTILNKFDYSDYKDIPKGELTWEQIQECKVNAPLFDLWGQGFVTVRRLKNADNVGAYLTAYMADLPLEDLDVPYNIDENGEVLFEEEYFEEETYERLDKALAYTKGVQVTKSNQKKAVIKGGRLRFYPRGTRLFNCVNCVEPTRQEMSYKQFKKVFGIKNTQLTLRKSVKIEDEETRYSSVLVKEQYNKKACRWDNLLARIEICRKNLLLVEKNDPFYPRLEAELYALENRAYLRKLENEYVKNRKVG
ncbi:rolling circle replication-associated protein [Enterococcus sp. DIV1420a]|uniref:rolling circle replication-associated protein n=1 Tax=Enterococcus sp. DIV1420a TaxID=2774672 RepID=UPI0036D4822C